MPASHAASAGYSFRPDRGYLRELVRPWKLATFALSMAWLLYGALNYGIADWDVGVTVIMGGLTYVCAPWSVYVLLNAPRVRPRGWPLQMAAALLLGYLVVDPVYWLYHTAMGNQMFRVENFRASSAIYLLAGTFWLYRGSLREMLDNLRSLTE